jgi:hypothetical protein
MITIIYCFYLLRSRARAALSLLLTPSLLNLIFKSKRSFIAHIFNDLLIFILVFLLYFTISVIFLYLFFYFLSDFILCVTLIKSKILVIIDQLNDLIIITISKSEYLKEYILQYSLIYNNLLKLVAIIIAFIFNYIIRYYFYKHVKNFIKKFISPFLNYIKDYKKIIWIIILFILAGLYFFIIFHFNIFFNIFPTIYADSSINNIVGFQLGNNNMPINISVEGTYVDHLFNKFGNKYGFIATIKTAGFIYGEIFDKIEPTPNPESIDQSGKMVFQKNSGPGCALNYRIINQDDPSSMTPNKQGLSLILERIPFINYNQMDLPKVSERSTIYKYTKDLDIENNSRFFMHFRKFKNLEGNKDWTRAPLKRVVLQRAKNFPNADLIKENNSLDNQITNLLNID